MNYDEVVKSRRSIRGYLDKPVPKELIREILEIAMRAPTSMNSQPWNFYFRTAWAVYAGNQHLSAKVRFFIDFLCKSMAGSTWLKYKDIFYKNDVQL